MLKKIMIVLLIVSCTYKLEAQIKNYSQFTVGLSFGLPTGDVSKTLNSNIVKLNIGQEFAMNQFFSLNVLGDFASTSGTQANPNINKIGLGGGVKIQMLPIINWILKSKYKLGINMFIASNGLININKIENYAGSGQMVNFNASGGLEFLDKKKTIYKIFYGGDTFIKGIPNGNIEKSQTRIFSQLGFAIGFSNLKKKQ